MTRTTDRSPKKTFLRLAVSERQVFLASFMHNMTIAVRGLYFAEPGVAVDRFKKWNELMHRLSGVLAAMLANSSERYPDELLIEFIESARDDDFESVISWALQQSFDAVEKYKKEKPSAPATVAPPH